METPTNAVDSQKSKSFLDHILFKKADGDKDVTPHGRSFRVNADGNVHFLNGSGHEVTLACLAGTDNYHTISKFFADSDNDTIVLY